MKNNCGFNVENFKKLFNARNVMRFNVFADGDPEPNDGNSPVADPPVPPVNFEQLIQKAREEEKNKLYPQITKLKEENGNFVKTHNEDLIAIATKEKEIDNLKKEIETLKKQLDGNETEAIKSLKKDLETAQNEIQTLKESAPNVDELKASIRAEIESEYAVKFYREKKIQEANGKIIPELVSGNTEEEINDSYEKAVARYNEIVGSITPPPVTNPKVNPANPSSTPLKTNADAMKALLELDPLSPEYKEARKALGFK